MPDTAHEIAKLFFRVYFADSAAAVLDVGSQNVNGSLRDCVPAGSQYTRIDIAPGDEVDVVLENSHSFPFEDGRFDAVVSASGFERDEMFWLTFIEMVRVTRHQGYVYIDAGSNRLDRSHSPNNWEFHPGAGPALAAWASHQGQEVALLESFVARPDGGHRNHCVLVFRKGGVAANAPAGRISDALPASFNVRGSYSVPVEEFTGLAEARDRLAIREQELEQVSGRLAAYEAALLALSRNAGMAAPGGNDFSKQLQELGYRVGASELALSKLHVELSLATEKQSAFLSEATQHYAETARLEREIGAQGEAMTRALDLIEARVAAFEAGLHEMRNERAQDRASEAVRTAEAAQRDTQLNGDIARLDAEIATRDRRIAELDAALGEQRNAAIQATQRLGERLDTELAPLTAQLEALRGGLDRAHAAITDINDAAAHEVFPALKQHAAALERLMKWRRLFGFGGSFGKPGRT